MMASPSKIMFVWGHRETLWLACQGLPPFNDELTQYDGGKT